MNLEKRIDARGKACPQPVIMTKKALDLIDEGKVITLVDNEVAKENVSKLVKSQGLEFSVKQDGKDFVIEIDKGECSLKKDDNMESRKLNKENNYVILMSNDTFGSKSEELGRILVRNYLYSLTEVSQLPSHILFVNGGVFLTTEDMEAVKTLKELEEKGVEILSCGTCLDYFGIKEKLKVGSITNMYDIVEKTTGNITVTI